MMRAKELMGGKCKMRERGKVGFCVRKVKQQQCSVYKLVSVKNFQTTFKQPCAHVYYHAQLCIKLSIPLVVNRII